LGTSLKMKSLSRWEEEFMKFLLSALSLLCWLPSGVI
jgi:hypothetical protein